MSKGAKELTGETIRRGAAQTQWFAPCIFLQTQEVNIHMNKNLIFEDDIESYSCSFTLPRNLQMHYDLGRYGPIVDTGFRLA